MTHEPAQQPTRRAFIAGRVVRTPEAATPYKVVLTDAERADAEYSVATISEGEALIREKCPGAPPEMRVDGWHV